MNKCSRLHFFPSKDTNPAKVRRSSSDSKLCFYLLYFLCRLCWNLKIMFWQTLLMKTFRFSPWFEDKQKRKPSRNHFTQEILTHRRPGYEDEGSEVSQRRVRTTQGEKTGQFMLCYMKCLFTGYRNRLFGLIHHYELYTTTWEISAICLAWSSGISAKFENTFMWKLQPFCG